MKIAVVYKAPSVTAESYKASWANGSPMPDPAGLLFHAGIGEGEDFQTVSVWESAEAYEAFGARLKKALGEQGFTGGPPQILSVHHVIDHGIAS